MYFWEVFTQTLISTMVSALEESTLNFVESVLLKSIGHMQEYFFKVMSDTF